MIDEIKLVCFDLNKTLIDENTWLDLNLRMGVTKEEDDFLFKLYDEGAISYVLWNKILEGIYKTRGEATRENITDTILKFTYKDGAIDVIKHLKDKGYHIALISGSMDILVERVAKDLNIELYGSNNNFVFDDNDYLESIDVLGEDNIIKVQHLQNFCSKLGIDINECACIGDGDNDENLFLESKHGITFKGSKLEHIAWKTISELRQLKDVL